MELKKTEESEKLAFIAGRVLSTIINASRDGRATVGDLSYLKDLLEPIAVFGDFDQTKFELEYPNLGEPEQRYLVEKLKDSLTIVDPVLEAWIMQTIDAVMEIYFAINKLVVVQAKYLNPSEA